MIHFSACSPTKNVVHLCAVKLEMGWWALCWFFRGCSGSVDVCDSVVVTLCADASELFAFETMSMNRSGISFANRLSSLSVIKSRNSASAAWCFNPARRMTSKSTYDKRKSQRASRAVESARLSIHLSVM